MREHSDEVINAGDLPRRVIVWLSHPRAQLSSHHNFLLGRFYFRFEEKRLTLFLRSVDGSCQSSMEGLQLKPHMGQFPQDVLVLAHIEPELELLEVDDTGDDGVNDL